MSLPDDQSSDEEVFFGKLSLKEVKKHILWSDRKRNPKKRYNEDYDLRIIETHSEPDLHKRERDNLNINTVSITNLSPNTPISYSNWDLKPKDDSFLKVEKMVTDLCISHESEDKVEQLNNTLDFIDYILKNGANLGSVKEEEVKTENANEDEAMSPKAEVPQLATPLRSEMPTYYTPIKNELNSPKKTLEHTAKPLKNEFNNPKKKFENTSTPAHNKQLEVFKTPKNPLSQKKASAISLKKTPSRNNAYQHIASPVASYIKNFPVAPLVKDVRPMKPLPGSSSIPIFVKAPTIKKSNSTENINLPAIAYKSARKTKVIDAPDEEKLPTTLWMKKITSSLPKPVILKHEHRENHFAKRVLGSRQEDSFADLSLHQADVSVCTKKSAFNKPKLLL